MLSRLMFFVRGRKNLGCVICVRGVGLEWAGKCTDPSELRTGSRVGVTGFGVVVGEGAQTRMSVLLDRII